MNIYLNNNAKEILDNQNNLKQNLADFLKAGTNSSLVDILILRIQNARVNNELLVIPFMSLKFNIWAGIFTSFVFIYRRLYLGFAISFLTSLVFSLLFGGFAIISFIVSVFIFGKLYEYFLLKKFIDTISSGALITNKCAPNIIGVIILAIINVLYLLLYIVIFLSAMSFSHSLINELNSTKNDMEIITKVTNLRSLLNDIKYYYATKGDLNKQISHMSNIELNNNNFYVNNQPCLKITIPNSCDIEFKNVGETNKLCQAVLKNSEIIKLFNADLSINKEGKITFCHSVYF